MTSYTIITKRNFNTSPTSRITKDFKTLQAAKNYATRNNPGNAILILVNEKKGMEVAHKEPRKAWKTMRWA